MTEAFIPDASVVIGWVHPTQATSETAAMLDAIEAGAVLEVPALWPLEVANALTVLVRRRRLSDDERRTGLGWLRGLPLRLDHEMASLAFSKLSDLAVTYRLSVYDAVYLELAERRALALACVTPVFVWNSQHDWITFRHSSTHFEMPATGLGTRLLRSGEFVASQLGIISPVTFAAFIVVGGLALRRRRQITRPVLFLLCFSVVPLSCVFALSLARRVMPNWPAPFYGAGLILTAAWLQGWMDFGAVPRPLRRLFPSGNLVLRRSVWCGIACAGLTCLSPWAVHWLGLAGSKFDPTVRLRGWSDFAEQVARGRTNARYVGAVDPRVAGSYAVLAAGRDGDSRNHVRIVQSAAYAGGNRRRSRRISPERTFQTDAAAARP